MEFGFPPPVPEIPVSDLVAAAAYYAQNLRFTIDWSDESLGLAGISKGDCRLFLATAEFRLGHGNVGPTLTWLNLNSKAEVDTLFQLWRSSDAKLTSSPTSQPWGLHEFTAVDLDGNVFRVFYDFATPERAQIS